MSEFRSVIPECGAINFNLYDSARIQFDASNSKLAEILKFDGASNGIEVFTNDSTKVGQYTVLVVGYLSVYPSIVSPDVKLTLDILRADSTGYRVGNTAPQLGLL